MLQFLSDFGGLYQAIIRSLSVIGFFLNARLFIGKIINEMYFVKICGAGKCDHSGGLGKKAV